MNTNLMNLAGMAGWILYAVIFGFAVDDPVISTLQINTGVICATVWGAHYINRK